MGRPLPEVEARGKKSIVKKYSIGQPAASQRNDLRPGRGKSSTFTSRQQTRGCQRQRSTCSSREAVLTMKATPIEAGARQQQGKLQGHVMQSERAERMCRANVTLSPSLCHILHAPHHSSPDACRQCSCPEMLQDVMSCL